jgi:hypothetical protein
LNSHDQEHGIFNKIYRNLEENILQDYRNSGVFVREAGIQEFNGIRNTGIQWNQEYRNSMEPGIQWNQEFNGIRIQWNQVFNGTIQFLYSCVDRNSMEPGIQEFNGIRNTGIQWNQKYRNSMESGIQEFNGMRNTGIQWNQKYKKWYKGALRPAKSRKFDTKPQTK